MCFFGVLLFVFVLFLNIETSIFSHLLHVFFVNIDIRYIAFDMPTTTVNQSSGQRGQIRDTSGQILTKWDKYENFLSSVCMTFWLKYAVN